MHCVVLLGGGGSEYATSNRFMVACSAALFTREEGERVVNI